MYVEVLRTGVWKVTKKEFNGSLYSENVHGGSVIYSNDVVAENIYNTISLA